SAHHVEDAPGDHRLSEEQRTARRGLADVRFERSADGLRVAAAAEGHWLDGHGGEPMLDGLDREVVLVGNLAGTVLAVVIDADDVVDTAPVTGNAEDGCIRRLGGVRRQKVAQDADTGPALEHELLAAIGGEVADFDGLRLRRRSLIGETADQLDELWAE